MNNQNKIPDFKGMAKKLMDDLLIDAEIKGLDFIHSNFEKQGFMNTGFEAWPQRKQPIDYKLLRVTNTLFNSINANNDGRSKVIFSADMPYAKLHNEGGYVKVPRTERMRKFFWAMFKATEDEKWKWMALSQKTFVVFRMPKRQFMGDSRWFSGEFNKHIIKEILTRFKDIKQV